VRGRPGHAHAPARLRRRGRFTLTSAYGFHDFLVQNGGGIIDAKNKKDLIDSTATKDAITFYMNLYKQGLAKTPSDLGVDWPGKALGEQKSAIVFEGGWLDSYMAGTYPAIKYGWMEMPKGKQKATLGFTVSFSIGKDSPNKKGAWVLETFLTGADGMKLYTSGGVANPSRKDVPASPGKEILVQSAAFAHPWSFIPGFSKVIDAFNNAITGAEQGNGSADTVVSKTKAAIDAQRVRRGRVLPHGLGDALPVAAKHRLLGGRRVCPVRARAGGLRCPLARRSRLCRSGAPPLCRCYDLQRTQRDRYQTMRMDSHFRYRRPGTPCGAICESNGDARRGGGHRRRETGAGA